MHLYSTTPFGVTSPNYCAMVKSMKTADMAFILRMIQWVCLQLRS